MKDVSGKPGNISFFKIKPDPTDDLELFKTYNTLGDRALIKFQPIVFDLILLIGLFLFVLNTRELLKSCIYLLKILVFKVSRETTKQVELMHKRLLHLM